MKISPYLNINRLEFIVTDNCTGRCKHCSFIDRVVAKPLGGFNCVKKEKAAEFIKVLSKYFNINSVMTFGGEPLLYPETVAEIHKTAFDCGIEKRQLITNGYFSKDEKRINEVALMLKNAGVNDVLISADSFHQEIIPLNYVKIFAENLQKLKVPARLSPAWVVNRRFENTYNKETERILQEFSLPVGEGNDIFLSGNAVKYLSEFYEKPKLDLSVKCGEMPYTDKLTNITSLSLEPNGDVNVCNFVIGNIYNEDIKEILCRYDPFKNKWMKALIEGGARGILELSEKENINIDTKNARNVCDICRLINKFI